MCEIVEVIYICGHSYIDRGELCRDFLRYGICKSPPRLDGLRLFNLTAMDHRSYSCEECKRIAMYFLRAVGKRNRLIAG
jgi:hypothetical protein